MPFALYFSRPRMILKDKHDDTHDSDNLPHRKENTSKHPRQIPDHTYTNLLAPKLSLNSPKPDPTDILRGEPLCYRSFTRTKKALP
jgi:hypothetical protein